MEQQTAETVRQIKQSFRLFMNGSASQSMLKKGLKYKINWGIQLPQLREMAAAYGKNHDLAVALWHEPIRECKIMATMIMPFEDVTSDLAERWMNDIDTTELSEVAAFYLFRHAAVAQSLSLEWLSRGNTMHRLCAYHILNRRIQSGFLPNENDVSAIVERLCEDAKAVDMTLRRAAFNCLSRLCEADDSVQQDVKKRLTTGNTDFLI